MTDIHIEPLQPEESQEAAWVLSKAFIQTELSSKVAGGTEDKHRRILETGFRSMLEKKPGQVLVAKDNEKIVGVMRMVEWPDCQNSIPRGIDKLLALIFARSAAQRLFKFRSIWAQHDPKRPHWHIDPIGVLPERQGQGVGSRLMNYFIEYIDKQNAVAYHETDQEKNVRFYNRFGFKVIDKEPIFSVTNWFLERSSKKS
jgi:ribosomal protein S18 acetylase RimI-like enzyme